MTRIRGILLAGAGLAMVVGAWLAPPTPTADAVCVHVANGLPIVSTTIRVGSCPTVPPADPMTPCPGSVGVYDDNAFLVSYQVLVCV